MDKGLTARQAVVHGKEDRRRILRDLPFPEKVKIVVQLQRMAAPAMRARGIHVQPWRIDSELSR
jgi:hypothetical protein